MGLMDLSRDLSDPTISVLPSISNYPTQKPISPFHDFFGLTPGDRVEAKAKRQALGAEKVPSIADRVLALQADIDSTKRGAALAAFRDVTTGTGFNTKAIPASMAKLEMWRDAEPRAFEPLILMAHCALERNKIVYALTCLSEAARRNPNFFVEKFDPGAYFGDRRNYERQLQRYVRVTTEQQPSPESLIIEAYCAALLGDAERARAATERAEKMALERSFARAVERGGVDELIWAVRAGVEAMTRK